MRRHAPFLSLSLMLLVAGAAAAWAAAPVIEQVTVERGSRVEGPGWVSYVEQVSVLARDDDGAGDIASVTIDAPDGTAHVVTSGGGGQWLVREANTIEAIWSVETIFDPPAAGCYSITAADAGGQEAALATAPAGEVPVLQLAAPGSVTYATQPTFRWDTGLEDSISAIEVSEAGTALPLWTAGGLTASEVAYNFDGAALKAALDAGRSHYWLVEAASPEDDGVSDPRVSLWINQTAIGLFAVYGPLPALPELPGKLAYGVCLAPDWGEPEVIAGYETDPAVRTWLGPVGAFYPDWSPEGTHLLYHKDGRLCIDPLDGSAPSLIPGEEGGDCRWSPDGERVVYTKQVWWDTHWSQDVWVARVDGSESHSVVGDPWIAERWPSWSPDGAWISYRRTPDAEGENLWLVRPDASDNHPLEATGVVGYPDYQVTFMGEHGWAPDGRRLVTAFSASGPGGAAIEGVGVIAREGGPLKPVFLTPEGVICCAAPHLPQWSPHGTKIVFTSGHHLDEPPARLEFESGCELWMINANGSGEPVRLTYNHSFDSYVSWWAPPIFWDVGLGHWAVCAVNACHEAGIVGGYPDGSYRPAQPVTRAQIAVYLARALAGGDGNVPPGPARPSFADVPPHHWAYRHVEYLKDRQVAFGYGRFYFPAWTVDRRQMAVFVARALAGGEEAVPEPAGPPTFPDVPAWSWGYRHVEYIASLGVTQGYPDGLYHPERVCTRDQMAVYVARAFDLPM